MGVLIRGKVFLPIERLQKCKDEGSQIFKVFLRMGAPHPLLDFNGCGRTRRTCTSFAPVYYIEKDVQWCVIEMLHY